MVGNLTAIRWQRGQSRRGPILPPLKEEHPASIVFCVLCPEQLGTIERVQYLIIGPIDDREWDAHTAGHSYAAPAMIVHEKCITKLDEEDLEDTVPMLVAFVLSAP